LSFPDADDAVIPFSRGAVKAKDPKYRNGSKAEISMFSYEYRFSSKSGHKFICATVAGDWGFLFRITAGLEVLAARNPNRTKKVQASL
jgi:hypothetical protein